MFSSNGRDEDSDGQTEQKGGGGGSTRARPDLFKTVGLLLSVVGLVFGIYKFFKEVQRSNDEAFHAKQLELYLRTSDDVGTIISTNDDKQRARAVVDFHALYWGRMPLVESPEVDCAMWNFEQALQKCTYYDDSELSKLRPEAIKLSHIMRASLHEAWPINELDPKPDQIAQNSI